jgi:mycofactocin biosynthetic radical S-adenosylmethionine protein MftC
MNIHMSGPPRQQIVDASLILVPQYFGSTIFERETSRYLPFDQATTALWSELADTSFFDLIAEVQDEAYRNQLWQFFEDYYNQGYFTVDGYFAGLILDTPPAEDHLSGPLAVHLEVSATCNLTCKHCFAGVLPRREEALTLAELDTLFATFARMGSYRLGLTGGEPLSRPELFEIIDLAAYHGLHPCLTTNALLITEEIAEKFGKRRLLWLNVSLDGATAASNDLIRGKGVFDRVMERLSILAQHTRFTLAFTIMKNNIEEIEACARLAYKVGAESAVFRPLYPVGIARDNLELMPTFAEYSQALDTLASLQGNSSYQLCNIDPFSPQRREETHSQIYGNHGCGAGNTICSVSVSGNVNPCSFLGTEHEAGNVRTTPFDEIWHRSKGFTAIRSLPGGTEDTFSGGCRVRALAFNGSINAPDPWISELQAPPNQASASNVTFYDPVNTLTLIARPAMDSEGL